MNAKLKHIIFFIFCTNYEEFWWIRIAYSYSRESIKISVKFIYLKN